MHVRSIALLTRVYRGSNLFACLAWAMNGLGAACGISSRLWPALVAVLLGPAVVLAQVPDASTANEGAISSVLVKLEQDKDAFAQFMEKSLTPRMQSIRKSFQENVRKADGLLRQLKETPESEDLAAEYEDVLSEALSQASTFMREFKEMEGPTFGALEQVTRSARAAKEALRAEAEGSEGRAVGYRRQGEDLREKLTEFAQRYQSLIEAGEALDPEVDSEIRILEADRAIALQNETIAQACARNGRQSTALLDEHLKVLGQVRGTLRVAFHQANGQTVLIANIAAAKKQQLLTQAMAKNLTAVGAVAAAKKADLEGIGALVDKLVAEGLGQPATNPPASGPEVQQAGADILRQYLRTTKTESNNDRSKGQ
jgi:hypothetical protein